jgi:hypothetical protein
MRSIESVASTFLKGYTVRIDMNAVGHHRILVIFLLLIALGLRLYYVLFVTNPASEVWSDMQGYLTIADDLSQGDWKEAHFFQSIGYPWLIGLLKKISLNWAWILGLLQALASWLSLVLVFELSAKAFGPRIGLLTLAVGTIHVPWILFPGFALPEAFFTLLLSISAWWSYPLLTAGRRSALAAVGWSVSFICAFWLKGTHVLWAPLLLAILLFKNKLAATKPLIIIVSILILGLFAHGLLTQTKINKMQLSASTGGLNLVEGKCPHKKNTDSTGQSWISPLYFQLDLQQEKVWPRPFTNSQYFMQQGLHCIKDQPFILIQSLEAIPFLFFGNTMWPFNQLPYASWVRLYEQIFAVFVICGLVTFLLLTLREHNLLQIYLWLVPVLSLFLCVYIFKSEIRYRVPFDIWLIPLSVKGWTQLLIRPGQSI